MKLKSIIRASLLTTAAIAGALQTKADTFQVTGVEVDSVSMQRHGQFMQVALDFDLASLKVPSNRAVILTPRLVNGNDSIDLESIGIYGRRRYYYYLRNGWGAISGESEETYRSGNRPDSIAYTRVVPYADWMNGAHLVLYRGEYGCCHALESEELARLGRYFKPEPFKPRMLYVRPEAEQRKARSLSGSAYIDFPVDQTVIYPDYRRNTVELAKIGATIDSVRLDKDITITQVWLKGFASPESPYAHNTDLAIGRTAALKKYLENIYAFKPGIITTDYEPEDWAGLRRCVEASNLEHRNEILGLIDSDMDPDRKEAQIKKHYPDEYRFMLLNWYPALRHTEYRINYDIRSYTDIDEIKRILAESPQKLSLNEFYLVAQTYEPGSPEFNEVFETAVRMYPNDEIANLNAANTAIEAGNFDAARRYLARSGNSPQAEYTRGALAFALKDLKAAKAYMEKARQGGVEEASIMLDEIAKLQ